MLDKFFNPKSVAIIGATNRPGSVGFGICRNLIKSRLAFANVAAGGPARKIFFVNPGKKKILGKTVFPSIMSIKEEIDLAIIAVPAFIVKDICLECAKKKVGGVIIISAGFAETGKEGEKRQKEIAAILKKAGIRFLGPNCLGLLRPSSSTNASFAPGMPKQGTVAFVSQSGALINSVIDKSLDEGYGFSAMISYGNAADLDICDFLKFLAKDSQTKTIALYLEGLKNGRELIEVAGEITKKKPIVVLKGGKTSFGKKAVSSHTASLAGEAAVYSSAFKKAGVFEVETMEDLLEVSFALSQAKPCDNGIGVITNGGAIAVLTADWCDYFRVRLPQLSDGSLTKLEETKLMHPSFAPRNPLDIIGDALSKRYEAALEAMLSQENIKGLIVAQTIQIMTEVKKNAQVLINAQKKYPQKPILALFMGGKLTRPAIKMLKQNSIPCFFEPRKAVLTMAALIARKK